MFDTFPAGSCSHPCPPTPPQPLTLSSQHFYLSLFFRWFNLSLCLFFFFFSLLLAHSFSPSLYSCVYVSELIDHSFFLRRDEAGHRCLRMESPGWLAGNVTNVPKAQVNKMIISLKAYIIKYLPKMVTTGQAVIGAGWTAGMDSAALLIKMTFFCAVTIWQPAE